MDPLLELLRNNALESPENLAKMLDIPPETVREKIAAFENQGIIRAYRAVIDEDQLPSQEVQAVIELRIRPEREGGFDRVASRVAKFPQVRSVFLMSGGYDLLLFVKGASLREVAEFVSARLATIDGVRSTATHFMLKTYKDQDVLMESNEEDHRLQVSP